jgi:hypothetical protein
VGSRHRLHRRCNGGLRAVGSLIAPSRCRRAPCAVARVVRTVPDFVLAVAVPVAVHIAVAVAVADAAHLAGVDRFLQGANVHSLLTAGYLAIRC